MRNFLDVKCKTKAALVFAAIAGLGVTLLAQADLKGSSLGSNKIVDDSPVVSKPTPTDLTDSKPAPDLTDSIAHNLTTNRLQAKKPAAPLLPTELQPLGGKSSVVNEWWIGGMATDGDTIVNWDNGGPDGSNGLSHFQGTLTGTPYDRVVVDDFVLDSEKALTWAQISGIWFAGTDCGTSFGQFRVRIWPDSGNNSPVAGPPVADILTTRKCETTGNLFFGRPEVRYTVKFEDTPIILPPGHWWVSIQPTGTTDNFFQLTSAEGPGNILGGQIHVWYPDLGAPQWTPGSQQFAGDQYDVVFVLGSGKPPQPEPQPECEDADLNNDGFVDALDLLILAGNWGPCGPGDCVGDINEDGRVDMLDVLILLNLWGCFHGDPPCGHPDAGDCCTANGSPNCDDAECCELICADDAYCCQVEWDGICASAANDDCDVCQVPPGDTCSEAIPVLCDTTVSGNTTGASFSGLPLCGTSHTTSDVWYVLIGTGGTIEVNTCGATFGYDTKLTVWTGTCGNLVCVGGNDDSPCPASGLLSRVVFNSVQGQTYYIMVHGFSQQSGPFDLNIICDIDVVTCGHPDAGDCCSGQPFPNPYCNDEDCCEQICADDPYCCNTSWDGACADAANDQCAVCQSEPDCGVPGTGNCCEANNTQYCEDAACCNLICGQDPYCCNTAWDSACAAAANDQCAVCDVPDGDTCATAVDVQCNTTVSGTTAGASFSGLPTCGTAHTTSDVWYRLIGTGGPIEVNTCGATFGYDTKLTVWTGTCGNLVCVGGNDDSPCPTNGLLSRVVFNSVQGQTYFIMVHGFSQQSGPFDLNIICLDPFQCPDGSTPEGEPCGTDTNGGCNSDPPIFSSIACGETICGNAWAAPVDGVNTRDTDWYQIVTTETTEFTFCVTAEFNTLIGLVEGPGTGNCGDITGFINPVGFGNAGQQACVTVTLGPGTWWWFVAPSFFTGMPCPGGDYHATLTCQTMEAGCGVPGTGSCCSANGSAYCDNAACCEIICADDPYCCNTEWDSVCAAAANDECAVCTQGECGLTGSCGSMAPSGCYCDEDCCFYQDCCPGKWEDCGGCVP